MFNAVRKCRKLIYFASFLVENNRKLINNRKPLTFCINYASQTRLFSVFESRGLLVTNDPSQLIITRNKSKSKRNRKSFGDDESSDEEEEEFDDEEDEFVEKGADIKTLNVSSLRADLIIKSVLGFSRKRIEELFYSNKIRINGTMLLKKSQNMVEGDEIDIIKKIEDHSLNTLNIGRVKILKAKFDPDNKKFTIKAWRSKSMIIGNYEGTNSWQETEESS